MPSLLTRFKRLHMRTGDRSIEGKSATIVEGSEQVEAFSTLLQNTSGQKSAASQVVDNPVQSIENEDPTTPHIRRNRRIGGLERRVKRLKKFFKPDPTPAELELIEKKRYNERIRRTMYREMITADKRIVNCLTNLGFCYTRHTKNEKDRIQKVHFSKWVYSDEGNTIYGRVADTPFGVSRWDLISERVLTELSCSVGHPVDGKLDENGLIYWVSLAGRNDFVDKIMWRDMLPKVPKTALPLTFIVGATKNGGREWRNLESLPHMLGGGETGGGKTNFMHGMICTFISRCSPADVRLLMIDLKFGGISLSKYAGIPHLLPVPAVEAEDKEVLPAVPTGIATNIAQAVNVLAWALAESTQRGQMFLTDKKHNPEKIEEWNKYHRTKHLPRIIIFLDELALLMDKSDVDSKDELALIKLARFNLKNILRLARSSGVHVCGFTQSLDKTVMGVAFKTNVSGRICFSVGDATASTLVVGNGDAVNLRPAGRAVYKRGTDKFMAQTPQITESDIAECVTNAKAGKINTQLVSQVLCPEDLLRFAIEEGDYSLNRDRLFERFKGQVSYDKLNRELLPGMERQVYELDGEKYTVTPGQGTLSRRVERLSDGAYTPVLADHPTPPVPPQSKKAQKPFLGAECPECGAPRSVTPCESCGTRRVR